MYWCLLGVLVVIIGFALKLEPIAIIVVSAIVTAIFAESTSSTCWKRSELPLLQTEIS